MKKFITLLLALSMLFAFAGCGENGGGMVSDIGSDMQSTIDNAGSKVESGISDIESGMTDNSNTNSTKITEQRAKEIAFGHAGVKEADAYDVQVKLEKDNGILNYEVDFETKTTEYDYHIHADTGEITSSSKEDKAD